MTLHFFSIPALCPELAQSELNAFLGGERVLSIRKEFVADGANSCWVLCVEVVQGAGALPDALRAEGSRRSEAGRAGSASTRVDYKRELSDEHFASFATLRDLRKRLAQQEGVPVYAVFTNEQLAAIAQREVSSLAAFCEIDGIGPARIERYGQAVLSLLQARRVVQAGPQT